MIPAMRTAFEDYYHPGADALAARWKTAIFAVDTNVLFNLYRYSPGTCIELTGLLKKLGDRLWLPHHAGVEFHRGRLGVVKDQAKAHAKVIADLAKIEEAIDAPRQHPHLSGPTVMKMTDAFKAMNEELVKRRDEYDNITKHDALLLEITELFKGKVGVASTDEELAAIYKEGKGRFERRVPPGYADVAKPDPDRYGDLVLWKQLIEHGSKQGKPVIWVSDDEKPDWLREHDGRCLGPRVELLQEFRRETKQDFWSYTTDRFMELAGTSLNEPVKEAAVAEAREVRERQPRGPTGPGGLFDAEFAKGYHAGVSATGVAPSAVFYMEQLRAEEELQRKAMGPLALLRSMEERGMGSAFELVRAEEARQRKMMGPALEQARMLEEQHRKVMGPALEQARMLEEQHRKVMGPALKQARMFEEQHRKVMGPALKQARMFEEQQRKMSSGRLAPKAAADAGGDAPSEAGSLPDGSAPADDGDDGDKR